MATLSNRKAVKARLRAVLDADVRLNGIQVAYGWPGQDMERECIYVGHVRGTLSHHDIRSGRKQREDDFTIDVWCWAAQKGQTAEEAEARAEVLYQIVDDVLAADPALGSTVDGFKHGLLTTVEGPNAEPSDEGYAAYVRAEIVCKSLLL